MTTFARAIINATRLFDTDQEIADFLGVSRRSISGWKAGEVEPLTNAKAGILAKLATRKSPANRRAAGRKKSGK